MCAVDKASVMLADMWADSSSRRTSAPRRNSLHRTDPSQGTTNGVLAGDRHSDLSLGLAVDDRENREIQFGPMKVKLDPIKVMFVFGHEDAQSDAFWWASEKLKYQSNMVRSPEAALESYLKLRHDLLLIDCRHSKHFDAEALCRTIRATKDSEHTVIVAVVKKSAADREEATVLPLLKSGFNRWFLECSSLGVCLNELVQLEVTEVTTRQALRAAGALFVALDHCRDAVEITNSDNEIEYANAACVKLLGCGCEDVLGKRIQDIHNNEHVKMDVFDSIHVQLSKGKQWEGTLYTKRKHGESIPLVCRVAPVTAQGRKTEHFVYVKECPTFWDKPEEIVNGKETLSHISALDICPFPRGSFRSLRKGSYDVRSLKSEGFNRRQSIAKTYSMTIEAPITKVINLISAAQENCPSYIAQTLDKVVEILRSTELYSPQFVGSVKVEDPVTTDLLGGLLSQGPKPIVGLRRSSNESTTKKGFVTHPTSPLSVASIPVNIPSNIKAVLECEADWDFDMLKLEQVTEKRPLVWLGMAIFVRFDACQWLKCDESTLQNWLTLIEANYHASNAYHTSTHAADVLQAAAYFLQRDRLKDILEPMEAIACLIAAVVHDVDHPGKTSPFLCNSRNELAILYNDLAVLESHHAATAFKLTLADERVNIFRQLDRDTYRVLRQNIIDMVLATEMTKHFEHLSKFVNVWTKTMMRDDDDSISGESSARESAENASLATPENVALVKRMIIKCADISNPVRPLKLCIEWAGRIAEEYCSQTEEEQNQGLPICMPIFDKVSCCIPKSQTGFVDIFIRDMFDALDAFMEVPELLDNLRVNYLYWKEQEYILNSAREQQAHHDKMANAKEGRGRARSGRSDPPGLNGVA